MRRTSQLSPRPTAGFTLVEVMIASSVLVLILLAALATISRDAELSRSTLGISVAEMRAQQMLFSLSRELADARGANPRATAAVTVGAGETGSLTVDSTLGVPPAGMLLLDRGTAGVERIAYAALGPARTTFQALARGEQCTAAATHAAGTEVLWAATAEPIALQQGPPASAWDGRAREATGTVFFRGDGSGFSYRVPTDPAGGADYIDGDDVLWGATVNGAPTLDGWAALVFEPRSIFDEGADGDDLNRDGDTEDLFDVGQIRQLAWDTDDPLVPASDVGLGPTVFLQERCNWGGDLDGDGFDDPIFLWDAARRKLHVRLFVIGVSVARMPIVRRVESVIFLRNEPEN